MNSLRPIYLLLFLTLLVTPLAAQHGIGQSFRLGRILPIHTDFPEIERLSFASETAYIRYTNGKRAIWPSLYRKPVTSLAFAYETLGNKETLGRAYSLTPTMGHVLRRRERYELQFSFGIGAAWLSRPYNRIQNPTNIANGSRLNFAAIAGISFDYRLGKHFRLVAGLLYSHYSNGNFSNPNIGANIPAGTLGIRYLFEEAEVVAKGGSSLVSDKKIHPFARLTLGLTERGLDGPKYPVYTVSTGVSRLFGPIHRVSTGFGYIYNTAFHAFQTHIELNEGKERLQSSRFLWHIGHEYLFGHFGFVTELGLYLNKFYGKRSAISSRIGFNFYAQNNFFHRDYQPFVGLYIHSNLGEAEFVELAAGFSF